MLASVFLINNLRATAAKLNIMYLNKFFVDADSCFCKLFWAFCLKNSNSVIV